MGSIDKLKKLAYKWGIEDINTDIDIGAYYALIYFDLGWIDVNKHNAPHESIAALSHEVGHWIMYKLLIRKFFNLRDHRFWDETLADIVTFILWALVIDHKELSFKQLINFFNSTVRR